MPEQILLGRYRLERILGEGGMGVVWEATHLQLEKKVALKLMRESRGDQSKRAIRLLTEARAVATIDNPHVVRMLDVDETEDGYPFLVMEQLRGSDLASHLKRSGPIAPDLASAWMIEAAVGLAEAHVRGIVHRDLKPENIFLAKRGGATCVTLLDFGVCRVERTVGTITQDGTTLGSPTYMAPEQLLDAHAVDARADIWALGVILYELVTGRRPFEGDTLSTIAARIAATNAVRPSVQRSAAAPLDSIILRCLEKRPEDRFRNVRDLAIALEPFAGVQLTARADEVERILFAAEPQLSNAKIETLDRGTSTLSRTEAKVEIGTLSRATHSLALRHDSHEGRVRSSGTSPPPRRLGVSLMSVAVLVVAIFCALLFYGYGSHRSPSPTTATSPPPSVVSEAPIAPLPTSQPSPAASVLPAADHGNDGGALVRPTYVREGRPRDPLDMELK